MKKNALITGASRGIGRGIAEILSKNGYAIAFTYNSKIADAQSLKSEIENAGGTAHFIQASLQDDGVAENVVSWAINSLGSLDVVVCNAGLTVHNSIYKLQEDVMDFVFNLDYRSYILCAREAAKHMIDNNTRGRLIFITSSRGQRAYPEDPLYGGMKAALHRSCESLALEYAPHGITINCVAPGNTLNRGDYSEQALTAARFQQKIPVGRSGTPNEVGEAVRYLVSENASYITGTILRLDGGLILPAMPLDEELEAGPAWSNLYDGCK